MRNSRDADKNGGRTWTTPLWLVDKIHSFAPIELDPCTAASNPTRAHRFYTKKALHRSWEFERLCYINPPYERNMLKPFLEKANKEFDREFGQLRELIVLLPAKTDTHYFHAEVFKKTQALVFLRGRLHFGGAIGPGRFASCLVYRGSRHKRFMDTFCPLGFGFTISSNTP